MKNKKTAMLGRKEKREMLKRRLEVSRARKKALQAERPAMTEAEREQLRIDRLRKASPPPKRRASYQNQISCSSSVSSLSMNTDIEKINYGESKEEEDNQKDIEKERNGEVEEQSATWTTVEFEGEGDTSADSNISLRIEATVNDYEPSKNFFMEFVDSDDILDGRVPLNALAIIVTDEVIKAANSLLWGKLSLSDACLVFMPKSCETTEEVIKVFYRRIRYVGMMNMDGMVHSVMSTHVINISNAFSHIYHIFDLFNSLSPMKKEKRSVIYIRNDENHISETDSDSDDVK